MRMHMSIPSIMCERGLMSAPKLIHVRTPVPLCMPAFYRDLAGAFEPPPTTSAFGWLPLVLRLSRDEIQERAGFDAMVFLEFIALTIRVLRLYAAFALLLPMSSFAVAGFLAKVGECAGHAWPCTSPAFSQPHATCRPCDHLW